MGSGSDGYSGYQAAYDFLIDKSIPVVIISSNHEAAKRIQALLDEYLVPCMIAPITHPNNVMIAINWAMKFNPEYY